MQQRGDVSESHPIKMSTFSLHCIASCSHFGFRPITPDIFQVGQIVHVQVAFTVLPSPKGTHHYIHPKLRSVALMDSSLQDVKGSSSIMIVTED